MSNLRDREIAALCAQTEQRLKADEAKLSQLEANLTATSSTLEKMDDVLSSFLLRLDVLRASVDPIHLDTFLMTRVQANAAEALRELETMSKYYDCAEESRAIFNIPPSLDNIHDHLDALARVDDAIDYFRNNNSENPEIGNLSSVRESEIATLVQLFTSRLDACSNPLEADVIHDIITEQNEFITQGTPSYAAPMCATNVKEGSVLLLKTLAEWMILKQGMRQETVDIVLKIRLSCLDITHSVAIFSSQSAASTMPNIRRRGSLTPAKTPKSNRMRIRRLSVRRQSTDMLGDGEFGADNGEMTPSQALNHCLALLRHEYAVLKSFLPRREAAAVLAGVVERILRPLSTALDSLQKDVMRCVEEGRHYSALRLFEILERGNQLSDYFLYIINMCDKRSLTQHFNLFLMSLAQTGRNLLNSFQESITQDPQQNKLPTDGTVHEITSLSLKFFQQLLTTAQGGGCSLQNTLGKPSGGLRWPDPKEATRLLSSWVVSAITGLLNNLELKAGSAVFQEQITRNVFLLNNFNYVKDALENDVFMEHVDARSLESLKANMRRHVSDTLDAYLTETWREVLKALHVYEVEGMLTKREREAIKASYSKFNDEFERVVSIHKTLTMPSKELRQRVCAENLKLVVPQFELFDNTFRNTGFSVKNPHKYLKYDRQRVELDIKSAFII